MKYFSFVILLLLAQNIFAQGQNIVLGTDFDQYFLVGNLPYQSSSNNQKLKVIVFGGSWHNTNLGESVYYISSRDGLKINREIHSGSTGDRCEFLIYENGSSYDFVIHFTTNYPSVQIRSWHPNNSSAIDFAIVPYDPTGKNEITSQVDINDIFTVSNAGDIELGTDNPYAKLTVMGGIHTQEVRVDLNGAVVPDYVFHEDYNLRSLSETEAFIKEIYNHLPEIPSAPEMEKNGMNLKEINLLLLKKVEELTTLYMFDLQDKNSRLEEQILRLSTGSL